MKKRIASITLVLLCQGLFVPGLYAQGVLYTFFVNIVDDGFPVPLIGIANIGRGNHAIGEIGLLNINAGSFTGIKTGIANITGGDMLGVNAGIAGVGMGDMSGLAMNVLNTAASGHGVHAGVANITFGAFMGLQTGVVNIAGGEAYGVQAGVVNVAGTMAGLQLGVVNIVSDGENTVPIGLIPIVLHNGYYAIEASVQDLSPLTIAVKMGVEKLYTTLALSYNFLTNTLRAGTGLGTLIHINDTFFFNMEINSHIIVNRENYFLVSATPALGYAVTQNLSIIAGPLVAYEYTRDTADADRFFKLAAVTINSSSSVSFGAKAAVRFRF